MDWVRMMMVMAIHLSSQAQQAQGGQGGQGGLPPLFRANRPIANTFFSNGALVGGRDSQPKRASSLSVIGAA